MSKVGGFFKKLRSVKNIELIIAGILCVVIVIIFVVANTKPVSVTDGNNTINSSDDPLIVYKQQMESQLCNLIGAIDGVKEVTVSVTFSSGFENVYAYETVVTTSANGIVTESQEIVYVDGKPLVLEVLSPKILGVAVVAKSNSNSAILKMRINEIIQKLLNVNLSVIETITSTI